MSSSQELDTDAGALRSQLSEWLAADAASWLESRRWFADKGRAIDRVEVEDITVVRGDASILALIIARIGFRDGGSARYFLPLVAVEQEMGEASLASVALGSRTVTLIDAAEAASFQDWLLRSLAGEATATDAWSFTRPAQAATIATANAGPASVMRGEQSNTSIRFGSTLIAKVIRRLQPAPNPEAEVLQALTAQGFPRVPAFFGAGSWQAAYGTPYPVVLAQAYVPNEGDGWRWMLERLKEGPPAGAESDAFAAERRLGRRTAELHVALSRIPDEAFAPAAADTASIAAEIARTSRELEQTVNLLRERKTDLPSALGVRLDAIVAGLRGMSNRLEGFHGEVGLPRIRVHGDYHLGQTLRTLDNDWMIIDFEGEPARPVSERRLKTSPLKDVAGMLRSFAYARGTAEREALQRGAEVNAGAWERGARQAFLAGYRQAMRESGQRLVPEADEDFTRALHAWELDKALYEIAYEARNRPDWLDLPLRSLLPNVFAQPPETTGAAPAWP